MSGAPALTAAAARSALREHADSERAEFHQRFFKTGKGQYAEGDRFLGVKVPQVRAVGRRFAKLPGRAVLSLLKSPFHEDRLLALVVMVRQFDRGDEAERSRVYADLLANTAHVNNWDLVDLAAPKIVGPYLERRSRAVLTKLAKSRDLWERRIAIMATLHFIRQKDFSTTLDLADRLLGDEHDLIHKAVGWMLREVGNRDLRAEEEYLRTRYRSMPRTMLRYAIEKFPERRRKAYIHGRV